MDGTNVHADLDLHCLPTDNTHITWSKGAKDHTSWAYERAFNMYIINDQFVPGRT
jgi:hypothetical protein